MKKLFLLAMCFLCILPLQAQLFSGDPVINHPNFDQQRWSWGYFLGFNTYDLDFNYNKKDMNHNFYADDISVDRNIGFNVGLIGNLRLSNHLDLRLEPGVSFNQINLQFFKADGESFREINQTYVHIPLLLKFSTARINNFKPFVLGGLSTSLNLSSNENNPDDNESGRQFRITTNSYYYEIGFGIDFYLFYFKFTPSIRAVFAINDQLIPDDNPDSIYTRKIDKMSTNAVFINFTFQ